MSKQHTPGPWTVLDGIPDDGGIGIGPDLEGIGPHAIVTFNGGESEANARLIAAAPDLLAAAEDFVAKVESGRARSTDSYAKFRVAIAKAKGDARDVRDAWDWCA